MTGAGAFGAGKGRARMTGLGRVGWKSCERLGQGEWVGIEDGWVGLDRVRGLEWQASERRHPESAP